MLKSCEKCSGCGFTVGFNGPAVETPTPYPQYPPSLIGGNVILGTGFPQIPCKKCGGTGYYDTEQLISVLLEFVKDEYWDKQ